MCRHSPDGTFLGTGGYICSHSVALAKSEYMCLVSRLGLGGWLQNSSHSVFPRDRLCVSCDIVVRLGFIENQRS